MDGLRKRGESPRATGQGDLEATRGLAGARLLAPVSRQSGAESGCLRIEHRPRSEPQTAARSWFGVLVDGLNGLGSARDPSP